MIYRENKGSFIHRVNYGLPFETLAIEEANGCPFKCEYCFLKSYFSEEEVVVYKNKGSLFEELETKLSERKRRRFFIGEYSEPLWVNRFSSIIPEIIEIFRKYPEGEIEIRTKGTDVDFLKDIRPSDNILLAWSLVPSELSEKIEKGPSTVEERIMAMKKTKEMGWRVGVRLEPIIVYKGWENGYKDLIERVSFALNEPLEMGAIRLTPSLRSSIFSRNPSSLILKAEFVMCRDGKLRYPRGVRFRIYNYILSIIGEVPVSIYMEEEFLIESLLKELKKFKILNKMFKKGGKSVREREEDA